MKKEYKLSILRGRMANAIATSDYSTPESRNKSIVKIQGCMQALVNAGEPEGAIVLAQQAIALEFDW
jgi:hypothetical protein